MARRESGQPKFVVMLTFKVQDAGIFRRPVVIYCDDEG